MATLVWLRNDLRLADNPALAAAASRGPVVPVFIWAPEEEGEWPPGSASRWWLDGSLRALDASLREQGSRLVVRRGPSLAALEQLIAETSADAVFWNRRYEAHAIERDRAVKEAMPTARSFAAAVLHEPWTVRTRAGAPYQVFTPFWRALRALGEPDRPLPAPRLDPPGRWPEPVAVDVLDLLPRAAWAGGLAETWSPGEAGAAARLDEFADRAAGYADTRDRPALPTSQLSPHLHFGEVSPRRVWHAVRDAAGTAGEPYLRQLGWREFAHHLLFHFPHTAWAPLRPVYERMPWRDDPPGLEAWRRGRTGYALVDAGMRQLWETGWMHNRVRMVTASFLTKDLLIDWRAGARWFWDTLVDADLANNTLGWQWVAGSGADAAPYHRVFNPDSQAARFDADGRYRERWLGDEERPAPMVDHRSARLRALAAHASATASRGR
ncbi:MAG TPA: deoxyribodipyrimidine photo-lyase [Gaiellales bacterium]